jgi:hypothetical protein
MKFWSDILKGIGKSEDLEVDNMRMDLREIGWEGIDSQKGPCSVELVNTKFISMNHIDQLWLLFHIK